MLRILKNEKADSKEKAYEAAPDKRNPFILFDCKADSEEEFQSHTTINEKLKLCLKAKQSKTARLFMTWVGEDRTDLFELGLEEIEEIINVLENA